MIRESLDRIYGVSSNNPKMKMILTPVVGSVFAAITALFIYVPVLIERSLKIPVVIGPPLNLIAAFPSIATGGFLMCWTSLIFFRLKGTPVPVNPPPQLVVMGPYKYSRNPMHGGLFLLMFGLCFYYSTLLGIIFFVPLYLYLDFLMLKHIEEPELVKRLGKAYEEYKSKTPMFVPDFSKNRN